MVEPDADIVRQYSIEILIELLGAHVTADRAVLQLKSHISYFDAYFDKLKAKSIVIEREYIDHDYLEDYSSYYVRCFQEYPRTVTRLHFFSEDFSAEDFLDLIGGAGERALTLERMQRPGSYIGFMVVKPLPRTIIGRTCLATYENDGGRRHYPITQKYEVNLYGIPLTVSTLAYQEQDSIVAACATSALWSVLHGTGKLFHHTIPSPVEITKAASIHIPHESGEGLPEARMLPNSGLTATQMAYAVRSVGLEPYLVAVGEDAYSVQSTAYAYMRGHVPLLLGIRLYQTIDEEQNDFARHAVALTGYSMGHKKPSPHGPGFLLKAARIDKLYAHDDQIGPFARMVLEEDGSLQTQLKRDNGLEVKASPVMVLAPLYHKIRIPFAMIEYVIVYLDFIIELIRKQFPDLPISERLEWDIFLTTVNEVKTEWFSTLDGAYRADRLLGRMPRYLWRAVATTEDTTKHLDLLFDATDLNQGEMFVTGIYHNNALRLALVAYGKAEEENKEDVAPSPIRAILRHASNAG